MKKILLISLILLFSLISLVNADIASVVVTADKTGIPGDTVTFNVRVTADASGVPATETITITSDDLKMGTSIITNTGTKGTITTGIGAGSSIDKTFNVVIPSTPNGVYSATIKASNGITNLDRTNPYTLTVNPKAQYSLSGLASATDNTLAINSQVSRSRTKLFKISNTGSVDLDFTQSGAITIPIFEDDDGTSFVPSINGFTTKIIPGETREISVSMTIPSNMDIGEYSEDLLLKYNDETNTQKTITIPLKITVDPKICKIGRRSDDADIDSPNVGNLIIDINEPDDGDNFKPGDKINIDVNVENNDNNDMDVIVEARLFNIDRNNEIESVESDSVNIDEDEDEDFTLTLDVPIDDSDLKDGDSYRLFIKTFEDGNEDENCNYDSIDMDFERESNDVKINKVTITPSVAACSETINFAVDVQNIGKKDQDSVQITLDEEPLGIDLSSEIFSLKRFDKTGDRVLKTFTFKIPNNAKEGDYFVESKVFFSSRSESKLDNKLTIKKCATTQSANTVDLKLAQTSFEVSPGKVFTVPLTLKNLGTEASLFTVSASANENWADISKEQSVNLASNGETTLYIYLTPKPSLTGEKYETTITVKQDNNVVKTEKVFAVIKDEKTPTGNIVYQPNATLESIWRNLANSTAFWITAIVVVFALIIFALSALIRPR